MAAALRRPGTFSYLVPSLLTGLVVQSWFVAGRFIAAGDISPFIRDNSLFEVGSLWQHTLSGAGSPSFDMARLPELAAIKLVGLFGGGEQLAQRLFLTLIAMSVVLSVTFLVRSFSGPAWLAGIAGLFAFFNPYLLVSFPNALPAWAVACMATLAGLVIRVGKGGRVPIGAFVLVSMACCYLALNPALFVVTCGWVVGTIVVTALRVDAAGRTRLRRFLQVAIPWALIANLWWIVAWSTWLIGSRGSFTGQTDVQTWSWTHSRNSLQNVLTLNGHWGWNDPKYFPYSTRLDTFPWNALRFCIPLLALAAPFVTKGARRRLALMGVGVAFVIVGVSKGLHEPLESLNLFLYRNVPGMWLLREPMSKLGAILVLLFSILLFFTMCHVWSYARTQTQIGSQAIAGTVGAAILLGLLYPYPMWTGAVIPDSRPVLPSAHVDVPAGWERIAGLLNSNGTRGKVLVLPLDDYYQVPTKWGYYGADRIPRSMLESPTLQRLPGGYFGDNRYFEAILVDIERFLLDGDVEGASRLLQALGVSHVVVRKDIDRSFPGRTFAPAGSLKSTLVKAEGIRPVAKTKVASVYAVESSGLFDVASTAVTASEDLPPDQLSSLVASIPSDSAAYEAAESDSVVMPLGQDEMSFEADWSQAHVSARLAARQLLAFVDEWEEGFRLTLRRAPIVRVDDEISDVGVVGQQSFEKEPLAIKLGGRGIPFEDGMGLADVARPGRVTVYGRRASESSPTFSKLHDCNRSDNRTMAEAGLRAQPLPFEPAPAIGLSANAHSACVYAATDPFEKRVPYEISLSYRTLQGRTARVCFWQEGPNRCAKTEPLEKERDWNEFRTVVLPPRGTKDVRLFLYADGGSAHVTRTEYRGVGLRPLADIGTIGIRRTYEPDIMSLETGSSHDVSVRWPGLRGRLGSLSDLRDCNAKDELSSQQAGLSASPLDSSGRSVRLQAQQHSACVSASLSDFAPGAIYKLEMDYRTLSGRHARVCVWQERVGRCANLTPLANSRSWRGVTTTFRAAEGTTGLKVFVYADGDGTGKTTTEYRGISLRPVPPASVVLRNAAEPSITAPNLSWSRDGASSYRVTLSSRATPASLIMNETYSDEWSAKVVGGAGDVDIEHQVVNGYANGWSVGPGEDVTLEIHYGPDGWYRGAMLISSVALIAALLGLSRGALRRKQAFESLRKWAVQKRRQSEQLR